MKCKKAAALLTAVSMVFTMVLSGCGTQEQSPSERLNDSVITEHQEVFDQLTEESQKKEPDQSGTIFRMYYDNTESMMGFVNPMIQEREKTSFVYSIDAAIDVASSMISAPTNGIADAVGYALEADSSNILRWNKVEINDELQGQFCAKSFYTGSGGGRLGTLTENGKVIGPLARLFQNDANPFAADGLTVVVSDLMEQGFNLDTLRDGIQQYFSENEYAAAIILGCTSEYEGNMSVPCFSAASGTDIVTINNYDGPAAYYFLIVGPRNLAESYVQQLEERLDDSDVEFSRASYYNSEDLNSAAAPLSFELVEDTMKDVKTLEGDAAPQRREDGRRGSEDDREEDEDDEEDAERTVEDVWGSANTDGVSAQGNAFAARVGRNSSPVFGNLVQLSAFADQPQDVESEIVSSTLYVYDEETGAWNEGSKNEQSGYTLRMDSLEGPVTEVNNSSKIIVAEDREGILLRCVLDFSEGSVLDRSNTYRVEVKINNWREDDSDREEEDDLMEMSITTSDFDAALSSLAMEQPDEYNWEKSSDKAREAAASALACTPKLNNLLNALSNLSYQPEEQQAQYVDFIFDASSGRR